MDQHDEHPERITVLARDFAPAAMEYHRRHLSAEGYALESPISRHRIYMVDDNGRLTDAFDGDYFAATFKKTR